MLKEIIYKLDHSIQALLILIIEDMVHGNISYEKASAKLADINENF